MQKQKSIISLNAIPAMVFSIVLIVGLGAVIGLWAYEIFETDKKLPLYNNIRNNNNIAQKRDKVDDEYFGNEFIQVKSPQKNNTIKSPVLVSGKANVFEGNVRVRIKDENKNILADTFITASGAYDKLYPFEKEISYTAPTCQNGIIEIFEEDMKDGGEKNKIIIPVVFEDYADVSDWKIYRNEEYGFEVQYPKNISYSDKTIGVNFDITKEVPFCSPEDRIDLGRDEFECKAKTLFNGLFNLGLLIEIKEQSLDFTNLQDYTKKISEIKQKETETAAAPSMVKLNSININNVEGFLIKVNMLVATEYKEEYIYLEKDKYIYIISYDYLNGYTDPESSHYDYDQKLKLDKTKEILSTFKFTEK